MTRRHRTALRYVFAAIVGMAGLLMSERSVLLQDGPGITGAEARVGRPLTPMSYAGVARRTTRRAVGYGASEPSVTEPRLLRRSRSGRP